MCTLSRPKRTKRWPLLGLVLIASLVLMPWNRVCAQTQPLLEVQTNAPEAVIYVDSLRLGRTSEGPWRVSPGTRRIVASPAEEFSWSHVHPDTTLLLRRGDTARVQLDFPYSYSISSIPPGASVSLVGRGQETILGETPLVHTSEDPIRGRLVFEKAGYDSVQVWPGQQVWNAHTVRLQGRSQAVAEQHVGLPAVEKRRQWITYAAAGLAVSAGVTAVYFRRRANDLEGDGAELEDRRDRYNAIANGSLVAMQVGVGTLAIRLIFR